MTKITLTQIAKEADVSIATVSKILSSNDLTVANTETIQKIRSIANKLGYKSKTKVPENKTYTVGIILGSDNADKFKHPYYSDLYRHLEKELHKNNIIIKFYYSMSEIASSMLISSQIIASSVDGLIIIDEISHFAMKKFHENFNNIINISVTEYGTNQNDVISFDSYNTVRRVIKSLIDMGKKNIFFTCGDYNSRAYILGEPMQGEGFVDARTRAFKDQLIDSKVPINEKLIHEAYKWNPAESYNRLSEIIKEGYSIDVVFSADESLSYACYKAIRDSGKKLPDDISLVSFDKVSSLYLAEQNITHIAVPKRELAMVASEIMLLRLSDKLNSPLKIIVPLSFDEGETLL